MTLLNLSLQHMLEFVMNYKTTEHIMEYFDYSFQLMNRVNERTLKKYV